jgi:hypothetical protein
MPEETSSEAWMAMHLRVGGRFVAAMALLLAVAGNAAFAQEHKTYRCKVADVVNWNDDGRLRSDSDPKGLMRYIYDPLVIDTLTGAITYPSGGREMWTVVKWRDGGDEYLLTRPNTPHPSDRTVTSPTDFIRIRVSNDPAHAPVRFLVYLFYSFASGPCEVVR